jgi:hypothetical protein
VLKPLASLSLIRTPRDLTSFKEYIFMRSIYKKYFLKSQIV